jgi:RNA-directed DNA polymerase
MFAIDKVDTTYSWLCKQRKHFPVNADIWHLRFHWPNERRKLLQSIHDNTFYFEPLQRITKTNGEVIHLWSSIDSLVLKLLAETLQDVLYLNPDTALT